LARLQVIQADGARLFRVGIIFLVGALLLFLELEAGYCVDDVFDLLRTWHGQAIFVQLFFLSVLFIVVLIGGVHAELGSTRHALVVVELLLELLVVWLPGALRLEHVAVEVDLDSRMSVL
jgi:hypothetical protein